MEFLVNSPSRCVLRYLSRLSGTSRRCYAKVNKAIDNKKYTDTVLLPQTKFPLRLSGAKRVETDNYLMEKCGFSELYSWQRENLEGPDFVLHDGPPYANGDPHMGHAVNKILKDITTRSRVIRGQRVHYVPGWDCHGLPIELKALSSAKAKRESLTAIELRESARRFARRELEKQRQAFASWGVMADWRDSGCYFTNEAPYMKNQLRQFIKLYQRHLVFRDFKPVYWSPSSQTALAESELEYNEKHQSKCATVRLRVSELPHKLKQFKDQVVYALTWTTTPWTLLANQALAYASDVSYCVAEDHRGVLYILAEDLLHSVAGKIGGLKLLLSFKGDDLEGSRYVHPVYGSTHPFLESSHVTSQIGTGIVHTAPAHGNEDFVVCLAHDIPVASLVDEDGRYTSEAGAEFAGLNVLGDAGEAVLKRLGDDVLHTETITHSYPYDWRTKKPVIIRASHQWFINTEALKQAALDSISDIKFYPRVRATACLNSFTQQITKRPYWCISRQRSWGTPIPVLYNKKTEEIVTNPEIIERLCDLLDKEGTDFWWTMSVEDILGKHCLQKFHLDPTDLEKGQDILDIWFDSGISWSAVLPEGHADLYLEGMDQFNGWFQSSLLTSIALQDKPPFKAVFVHGFTVDKNGEKMSKSLGNVISPEEIIRGKKSPNSAYGTDVLRWWVASHGVQHTHIPIVENILRESAESVQKIRSVLRFLLGAIHQYDVDDSSENTEYLKLDKYMLHRLYHYNREVQQLYDSYEYHHVCKVILNFITNDVSALYCPLVKDRLYCEEASSPCRLGAVDVIDEILTVVTRSLAPIVPHLAEEIWLYYPDNLASVPLYHSNPIVPPEEWNSPDVEDTLNSALLVKTQLNKIISGNSLELDAVVTVNERTYSNLLKLQDERISSTSELSNILQVSSVTLLEDASCASPKIDVRSIEQTLCKRCRKYPESAQDQLCARCKRVLNVHT